MNLDDAREIWRSSEVHEREAGSAMSEREIMGLVTHRAADFERIIRRRDRLERFAMLAVGVLMLPVLLAPSWVARLGVVVLLAAGVLIHARLRGARRAGAAADPAAPLAEMLRDERAKVDAQIGLLETVLWWYIAPLALGVLLVFGGLRGPSWLTLGYALLVVAGSVAVYRLNQRAVRLDLRPRRQELTQMIEQLDADGDPRPPRTATTSPS